MKFFIDSADPQEIADAEAMGLLDGVTTNPSLLKKAGLGREEALQQICSLLTGPVSGEAVGPDLETFLAEGLALRQIADNMVVKLPCNEPGLKACRQLASQGIPVNMTLIFQPVQALLCARAGATFVSPFLGRLDDICSSGMELIEEIRVIFDNYALSTQILAASIRSPEHVKQAALAGADVCTVPLGVIKKLLNHPLTDRGIATFETDAGLR
ncbi:MAG: transaldolase family protein [Myxococcota bacterium]|jgi:transaldolase|nr:fructose-6-phosphate aldolase [Myxococcales bacterium]MBF95153.1 fructose-6-phosphate aldolase [Myxococcales bacterium]MEC7750674.1 transaldolase family protein [Myxococcota bacterium]HBU47015.1 fructose-6-phosphate aldolase [Myxococcales bacterium]|tara:strand:+ start:339 stop:977 length:639 start_codon:yes stop_codon:yes gene_type:complete